MHNADVVIIGAGIIGLAIAYHLVDTGAKVTIIDRDPEGDKASVGNAGGIAVTEVIPASSPGVLWRAIPWMMDPLGPLAIRPLHAPRLLPWLIRFAHSSKAAEIQRLSRALASLNSRVYDDLLPLLRRIGMLGELHRDGALTLYETSAGLRRDRAEWEGKRAHGIHVEELTGDEARNLEPALGPLIQHAVFTPEWSHISDPQRLLGRLREWLIERGVAVQTNDVRQITAHGGESPAIQTATGAHLSANFVVVAAGAWSGELSRQLGDRALLESERGYNMTIPEPGVSVRRELIFAERKFVATPLACGLRIGGAAEFGGLRAPANYLRSRKLVTLASRYLPALQSEHGTSWAGHRPTTPDSLPVIGASTRSPRVIYAFGHGHLGLTQAATTGRLVSELIGDKPVAVDLEPFSIGRFR